MLYRDPAAERRDPVDVAVADRFGVIEKPVDTVKRNVLRDLLVYVQRAADRLVVGGMQSPRPFMLGEQADDRLEIASMLGGMSGRSTRKSSKSAAE